VSSRPRISTGLSRPTTSPNMHWPRIGLPGDSHELVADDQRPTTRRSTIYLRGHVVGEASRESPVRTERHPTSQPVFDRHPIKRSRTRTSTRTSTIKGSEERESRLLPFVRDPFKRLTIRRITHCKDSRPFSSSIHLSLGQRAVLPNV
jgi:hypothetical protein